MGLNHPFGHDKPSDRFLHRPAATVRLIHIHLHAVLGAFLRVHPLHRLVHFLELELLDASLFSLHGGVGVQRDELTGLIAGIVVLMPGAGRR